MRNRISQRSVSPTRSLPFPYHSSGAVRNTADDGHRGASASATDMRKVASASAGILILFTAHFITPSAVNVASPSRAVTPSLRRLGLRSIRPLHCGLSSARTSLAAASGSGGRLMTWLRIVIPLQGMVLPDLERARVGYATPTSATNYNAATVSVVAQRRSLYPPPAPSGVRGVTTLLRASSPSSGAGGGRGISGGGDGDVREDPGHVPAGGGAAEVGGRAGGGERAGVGAAIVVVAAVISNTVTFTIAPAATRVVIPSSIAEGTVITAMVITPPVIPSPLIRSPRWPFTDASLPLPRLLGSSPSVLVGVANGSVVVPTRTTDDTRGSVGGVGNLRDEPRAAACVRTTSEFSPSVNATTPFPLTVVIVLIPSALFPPGDAGSGDGDSGHVIDDSSLLRNGDSTPAGSNSVRGHRRSSGSLRRADHCLDGLPGMPPAVEQA